MDRGMDEGGDTGKWFRNLISIQLELGDIFVKWSGESARNPLENDIISPFGQHEKKNQK